MIIYTDGSYDTKNFIAGWGFCAIEDNKIIFENSGWKNDILFRSRNITGEVEAVIQALLWINEAIPVHIVSDYSGIKYWGELLWKAKKDIAKYYVEFLKNYRQEITFEIVKGHTGVEFNERADKLAEEGKLKYVKLNRV